MRNLLVKRFSTGSWGLQSNSSLPFLLSYRRNAASGTVAEEEAGVSYGLNRALARMGVFVKGKAFRNLSTYELQQHGATTPECLSGIPLHIRGNVSERASGISKTQFNKLLKQVTSHISSISNVFVHDVAIGSSPKCDAKVRVISDGPSPVLSLSNILWNTSARAISHDSCPLTVYVATSINQGMVGDIIGLGSGGTNGFVASDIDRLSLVLCGRAFSDTSGIKQALSALSGPIIAARGGLPLSASCDIVPSVSRLSPGQAAYHFLAGYQNGNFVPVYNRGPSSIDPLELAKALLSKVE